MKFLSFFSASMFMCLYLSLPIFAQKIKNEKMNVKYHVQGSYPFPLDMRVADSKGFEPGNRNFTFPNNGHPIHIPGFKMENSPRTKIILNIFWKDLMVIAKKIVPTKYTSEGKEVSGFMYSLTVKYPLVVEIQERPAYEITSEAIKKMPSKIYFQKDYSLEQTYTGPPAGTEKIAENHWFNVGRYEAEKDMVALRDRALSNARNHIASIYGAPIENETLYFSRITQDKKGTYQAFEVANDSTEAILKKITLCMPYEKEKKRLKPYYDFWIKAKDSLVTSQDKINKNLAFVAIHNASLLSILWEDLETTEKLIKEMENLNMESSRIKNVKEFFVKQKRRKDKFDQHIKDLETGKKQMHIDAQPLVDPFNGSFVPVETNIKSEEVVKEFIDPKFNFDENIGFLVTRKGDTTFGYVYQLPETFREDLKIAMITREKEIVRFLTKDVWSYSVKGEIYRLLDKNRRFTFDVNAKFEGVVYDFHILRYSSEKMDFFEDANFTNTYYYYYKDDRSATRFQPMAFASSDKILADCFKVSCPELAKSILGGAYKDMGSKEKNRELAKIVINEYETKCGTNKKVQESFIVPEKTKKLYKN